MGKVREIIFRGKRLNGDGWVYGDLSYHVHNGEVYVFPGDGYDSPDCYEVDPATVGQWTGLTDKNGKRIFEGDIIKWDEKECGGLCFDVVEWDYSLLDMRKNDWKEFCWVVCNIHDNLEFLKEDGNAPSN